MKALTTIAVSLLQDTMWFLERISETSFTQPLPRFSGTTIGQQTRPVIERFQSLTNAMRAYRAGSSVVLNFENFICYEAVEYAPRVAWAAVEDLSNRLPKYVCDGKIFLEKNKIPQKLETTFEREMLDTIEFTIHSLEAIQLSLKITSPCLQLPDGFGKMPFIPQPVEEPVPMYPGHALHGLEAGKIAV